MRGRASSLRRRIRLTLAGLAGVGLVGVAVLVRVSTSAHARSVEATADFVEDERISDRVTRAVIRQFAVAAAFPTSATERDREEFLATGLVVHDELRRYLFGELTPDERVRLAGLREAHQRFEVQAVQAAALFGGGGGGEADRALASMAVLADEFLEGLEGFFVLRLDALDQLQRTQEALLEQLRWGVMLLAVGLLGLSLAAAWELNRRVARPLHALAQVTEQIAAGNLEARLPTGGDDEFRTLARRFNRMAVALEQRTDQLTRALAEVKEAQAELVESEKLGAVGRMSAGFAHEINNPLTSVLGYADLLFERVATDPPPGPAEVQDLLDPIRSEATRARTLVRSLLQVARRPEGAVGSVPVREALEVVVGLRSYAFRQAGLELWTDGVPHVSVRADPHLLQGIFLNLINNAYDAMCGLGGGTLTISGDVSATDRVVELDFTDTGPGLPDPDRIFEPFFTTKAVGEGTGLGLSLVHQFVTSFGGSVRAVDADGGGARFVVRVPLAEEEAVDDFLPVDDPPPPGAPGVDAAGTTTAAAATATADPLTVLVVEDEPHLLLLHRRILERHGMRVVSATGVEEARRALERGSIDLVVSDVKMPGESGVVLFEEVREHHPQLAGRFLFVTGDATVPELVPILRDHKEIVLWKPFRTEDYLDRIRAVLGA
ncbi:MAG: hybrid sensor histidine kinase/response regulator [Longimicrobiales bacterium]|nr:hybrid sensor histidine kinase/response regulator [Longimicrobiales bacterium]